MAGISSKAAGELINKKKFNTWERNEDLDLFVDESFYRVNDYQIGRFWQPDPKIEMYMESWSPYTSNLDNPILYNDPQGDCPLCVFLIPGVAEAVVAGVAAIGTYIAVKHPVNAAAVVDKVKETATGIDALAIIATAQL